jgi:RNA polymerase primary sigma factor
MDIFYREKVSNIRYPNNLRTVFSVYAKASDRLAQELDREPSKEEVAEESHLALSRINSLIHAKNIQPISLYATADGDDNSSSLYEFIKDSNAVETADEAEKNVIRGEINEVLSSLDEREDKRERGIIEKRFGFDGEGGKTLAEVSREYKVSRERIRQIESRVLLLLKDNLVITDLAETVF